MLHWIPYAFVRIVVFFMAGILLGIYAPDLVPEQIAKVLFLAVVLCYVVLVILLRNRKLFNPGFLGLSAIFLAGYLNLLLQTDSRDVRHFIHIQQPLEYYHAVVVSHPDEKDKTWKTEAVVLSVKTAGGWESVQGKVILYISKNDFPSSFHYGDVLLVKGTPARVQPPANPGEFDYQRFLSFRKIYHQHFIRKSDACLVGNDPPSVVMNYAIQSRVWAKNTLDKFIRGEREQATASALVLGVTDGLDDELLTAYASTGAMHVLSVSGLHVGILYWIILLILKPLNKTQKGQWIVAGISVAILWLYAFVTGVSPSVLRAVTMFSLVALARPWNKSTNIYNILAASAFCLLLYEPYLIMSVGFQLSYLAVLGIVYLQPALYRLWEPDQRIWDEVWKIISVSIAAQVATFPLGLLYFHQFPNYFLLSNLVVIPASFLVLVGGVALLAVSFISPVAGALGFLLEWLIRIMNFVIFSVEKIPFSLIEDISITPLQCVLLLAMIATSVLLIQFRKFYYVVMAAGLVLIFAGTQWIDFSQDLTHQKLTVYKVPGHRAMDLTQGGTTYFFSDSALQDDKIRFHIRPNRLMAGVGVVSNGSGQSFTRQRAGYCLMYWNDKTILYLLDKDFQLPEKVEIDFLIIGNNAVRSLGAIADQIKASRIVLDSSNSFYIADRLLKESPAEGSVHSVLHQGAFSINLESVWL